MKRLKRRKTRVKIIKRKENFKKKERRKKTLIKDSMFSLGHLRSSNKNKSYFWMWKKKIIEQILRIDERNYFLMIARGLWNTMEQQ